MVGRESRRETWRRGGHKPVAAKRMAFSRRRRSSRSERLTPLRSDVCDRLARGWWPEPFAGLRLVERVAQQRHDPTRHHLEKCANNQRHYPARRCSGNSARSHHHRSRSNLSRPRSPVSRFQVRLAPPERSFGGGKASEQGSSRLAILSRRPGLPCASGSSADSSFRAFSAVHQAIMPATTVSASRCPRHRSRGSAVDSAPPTRTVMIRVSKKVIPATA
jgi:hypothetical protein